MDMRMSRDIRRFLAALLVTAVAASSTASPAAAEPVFGGGWYGDDVPVSAPSGLAPATGSAMEYPTDPLVFSWDAVPGNTDGYNLQIARLSSSAGSCTDSVFGAATVVDVSLPGRNYVPTLEPSKEDGSERLWTGSFCWRVRADGDPAGAWSASQTFSHSWSSTPTTLRFHDDESGSMPRDGDEADADSGSSETSLSGYLSWDPVPGAAHYDVEVSPSKSFANSSIILWRDDYKGSRLPLLHIPDDTYYWRVRATSPNGMTGAWTAGPAFTVRWVDPSWNEQSEIFPDYDQTVDDVRVGWRPLRGAAMYEVQMATRPGCFWQSEGTAPETYGSWVKDEPFIDDNGTPSDTSDDVTIPAPRRPNQCRLSPVKLTTMNNWLTLPHAWDDEVWENMNMGDCDGSCLPVALPTADASPVDGGPYKVFWRVRPVKVLTQPTETGWRIGDGGEGEQIVIHGRWSEYEPSANHYLPHRFNLDVDEKVAVSVANRCDSPDNPTTDECLSHGTPQMHASDLLDLDKNSASMQMPLFTWDRFPGNDVPDWAGGYILQIARDPDFTTAGSVIYEEVLGGYDGGWQESYAMLDALPDNAEGGGYWWRAIPCEAAFGMGVCTPLYYPPSIGVSGQFGDAAEAQEFQKESHVLTEVRSEFSGASPLLRWTDAATADYSKGIAGANHYEVEIATDERMSDALTYYTTSPYLMPLEEGEAAGTTRGVLPDDTWFWRVRAIDQNGIEGGWSEISSFEKVTPAPATYANPTQASGAAVAQWEPVDGADRYEFVWSEDPGLNSVLGTTITAQTAHQLPAAPGTYYWSVRALLGSVAGSWSPVESTQVGESTTIDYRVSTATVAAGKPVYVEGIVREGGQGVSSRTVELLRKNTACNAAGTYTRMSSQATGKKGEEGVVRFGFKPDRNRCVRMAVRAGGGTVYSAPIPVNVRPTVKLIVKSKRVRRGKSFKATVRANRKLTGRVQVQYKRGNKWFTARTLRLRNRSAQTFTMKINTAGRFQMRARVDQLTVNGAYKAFEDTSARGPNMRVNDLYSFFVRR